MYQKVTWLAAWQHLACQSSIFTLVLSITCMSSGVAIGQTIVFDPFTDGGVSDGADPLDVEWSSLHGAVALSVVNDDGAGLLNSGNAMLIDRNSTGVTGAIADLPGGERQLVDVGDYIKLEFDFRLFGVNMETNVTNRGFRGGFFTRNGTPGNLNDDKGYYFQSGVGDPTFFADAARLQIRQELGTDSNGPANGGDGIEGLVNGTLSPPLYDPLDKDNTGLRSAALTLERTALGITATVDLDGATASQEYFAGNPAGAIDLDRFEYFGIFGSKLSTMDIMVDNVEITTNAPIFVPGFLADFDGDDDVDGADFLSWQRDFGTSTDATDLANWENEFGNVAAVAAISAVPEPASLPLAGMMAATLAVWRRRLNEGR